MQNQARHSNSGINLSEISFAKTGLYQFSPAMHDVSSLELSEFLTDESLSDELTARLLDLQNDLQNPDFRDVYNNPIPHATIAEIARSNPFTPIILAFNFSPLGPIVDAIDIGDSLLVYPRFLGSSALYVKSWISHNFNTKQIELSSSIHLTFDKF